MNLTNPPAIATLVIPKCGLELCPWKQFKQIALTSINTECVQEPLQSSLIRMQERLHEEEHHSDNIPHWVDAVILINICTVALLIIAYYHFKNLEVNKPESRRLLNNSYDEISDVELVTNNNNI